MAIGEKEINGQKFYEVTVNFRSKHRKGLRVQRKKSLIKSLREAQATEREFIRDAAEELARKEGSGVPWAELVDKFELAHRRDLVGVRKVQKDVLIEVIKALRRFCDSWAEINVQEITPGDVRSVFAEMREKGYSRSRLRTIKWGINMIFRWGIEEGVIKGVNFSPALHVIIDMPKDEKPPKILTASEIDRLLQEARSCDHTWYPVWFVALNTGMRSGELYALEWSDVDLENRLITVSKSWNNRLGITKSTKAGYWRKVPINRELFDMLLELRALSGPDESHVLPRIPRWKNGDQSRFLREFCGSIGITPVNFHALRACFATHLLNAGVSSPIVKKICGWTEEKVMSRYIRLAGVDVAGATESLGFGTKSEQKDARPIVDLRELRLAGSKK